MSKRRQDYRSELSRARGLGSAKEGVQHWWVQRLTALALIPLTLWLVAAVVAHAGMPHAAATAWIGSPVTVGLLVLLLAAAFHHAQLGLQVVIEDYVHTEATKIALLVLIKGAALVLALVGILAVLFIAFGD